MAGWLIDRSVLLGTAEQFQQLDQLSALAGRTANPTQNQEDDELSLEESDLEGE